ncbi:spartin a [Chanos chanos]|uniref:Spartin n=1 Tax=Chanos chanos TaxID=29144 RepID=A0A6J2WXF2_CHACN|nr:spartin [Chanos chanos]
MESTEPAELHIIKDHYEKAFECLNTGLAEDEAGNKAQALILYRLGRRHILQGLEVPTHGEWCVGVSWDAARQMQMKMNETLSNITTRLAILETTPDPATAGVPTQRLYPTVPRIQDPGQMTPSGIHFSDNCLIGASSGGVPPFPVAPVMAMDVPSELPPAYTPQAIDGHVSLSSGKEQGLQVQSTPDLSAPNLGFLPEIVGVDEEEIFFLPHGVQVFFVAADGQVSAPSFPGYLRIILLSPRQTESTNHRIPSAYLQVCNWLCPLFPDSPVLLSNTGVFTFPNTMAATPGSYVGIVLSAGLPESDRSLFQEYLSALTDLRVQAAESENINLCEKVPVGPPQEEASTTPATGQLDEEGKTLPVWSEKLSHGILAGASWLGQGLAKGAEATGKAIHRGASKLRDHITPDETPAEVSPKVAKSLHVARQATGGAVKVSQFLVDGVSMVAGYVGRGLAPHVKKHGSKLVPESLKKNKDGQSNLDGVKEVAVSSIQGLSTVWSSLETAAKSICKSVGSETVTTVKHKFRGLENI